MLGAGKPRESAAFLICHLVALSLLDRYMAVEGDTFVDAATHFLEAPLSCLKDGIPRRHCQRSAEGPPGNRASLSQLSVVLVIGDWDR